MDVLFILFLTLFVLCLHRMYQWYLRRKKIWDAIEPFGGEKWYPILGTTLPVMRSKREDVYAAYAHRNVTYAPTFRAYLGSIPTLNLTKPEHIEIILNNTNNLRKGYQYHYVIPLLGDGLITGSNIPKWHHHRKLITPTFHFSILDNMMDVMTEKAQMLADNLEKIADGRTIEIYRYLTHCELDIICETAMGVTINAMKDSDSEYVRALYGVLDAIYARVFRPYLHWDFIFRLSPLYRQQLRSQNIVHGFARKVIQERKEKLLTSGKTLHRLLSAEDREVGKKERLAFLDLLLEANKKEHGGLTDEEIREEVDTFMFAGHDTSTATVSWTLLMLCEYPEYQEKIQQELDEIFHGEERQITPQDLNQMQLLERVVKESMRMTPVVPVISRELDKEIVIDGRMIPAGVSVSMHLARLHKDPQQFPDPERFDPDRFLPENVAKRHPYAFLPFSAGPRNCVGQKFAWRNVKILLASLLRKYTITADKKRHEYKYVMEIVLRPHGGLLVQLHKRTNICK